MKTAIVFHGLSGSMERYGFGEQLEQGKMHANFKENILEPNKEVGVFMHSWSCDKEEEITSLYQPISKIFEKQIIFKNRYTVGHEEFAGARPINNKSIHRGLRFHNMYSKWYSAEKAIGLMEEHEKANNFNYDLCMLVRFDLHYNKKFTFDNFSPQYVYLTSSPPVERDMGFSDLYTLSSSENAKKLFGNKEGLFSLICSKKGNHFASDYDCNHGQLRKIIEAKGLKVKKLYPARHGGSKDSIICLAREVHGVDASESNARYEKRSKDFNKPEGNLEYLLK